MTHTRQAQKITNGDTVFYQFDPQVGFWGVPNMQREVYFPQRPDTPVWVKHNSAGNRDSEVSLAAGERTILCMGGSHTWGGGVDQDERYTDVLSATTGMKAVNMGHCSFGLDQLCLALMQRSSAFNPKVVVVEQYPWAVHRILNNYVNGYLRPYFYLDKTGAFKLNKLPSSARVPALRKLIGSYYAFRKEFNEFKAGINIKNGYDESVDPIFLHWKTRQYDYMYELIDHILQVMRDYCRQHNIKLIFALGAIKQQFDPGPASTLVDYELPRDRLIRLLGKNKIQYVDMTDPMLGNHTAGDPVIFADGHINAKGHKVFGDTVRAELTKLNWL